MGPAAPSAELLLAQQYEREGRRGEAEALLRKAADAGDPNAQYFLGAWLLGHAPAERPRGVELVSAAAARGHPQALHLQAVMAAAGFGQEQDWSAAMRFLAQAVEAGHMSAQGQIALLGSPETFNIAPWLQPPASRMVFTEPRVGIIESFLAPEICDWIVAASKQKRLCRAEIIDPATGGWRPDPGRTNTGLYLNLQEADLVTRLIKARIGAALGLPVSHQEDANVLHYAVGQVFHQHCDFLDPAQAGYAQELATFGQRAATFLIYLNDDFDGGETAFPLLDWSFRGRKGDALFFWNISTTGEVERKLLHAGRPPTRGEKWLFSQWAREQPVEGAELPMQEKRGA